MLFWSGKKKEKQFSVSDQIYVFTILIQKTVWDIYKEYSYSPKEYSYSPCCAS